jgi:hypothetical protein
MIEPQILRRFPSFDRRSSPSRPFFGQILVGQVFKPPPGG